MNKQCLIKDCFEKIVGHRGASENAPENTLESLKLAWEHGAYAAECDIIRTRQNNHFGLSFGKIFQPHGTSLKI